MIKDSITVIDSLSKIDKAHIDSLLNHHSIHDISIIVLGKPDSMAKIWIPASIPIIVLAATLLYSWYIRKKSIWNEAQSYRRLILEWIELIGSSVNSQIESCTDFVQRIENTEVVQPEKILYIDMLAEKVNSIGLDRFINTFIINSTHNKKNTNNKMTYNLIAQFNYLQSVELELKNTYNIYHEQMTSFLDDWNKYFIEFHNLISHYSKTIGKDEENLAYNFHIDVNQLSNQWINDMPKSGITKEYVFIDLIKPLSDIVKEELSKGNKHDYVYELSSIIGNFNILRRKLESNINGNALLFRSYATNITTAYSTLITAKDYFNNNTKVLNIWNIK